MAFSIHFFVLLCGAVITFAPLALAEELPPLEDYQPPPLLFDGHGEKQKTDPFLTTNDLKIDPAPLGKEQLEKKQIVHIPAPPKKPIAPARIKAKTKKPAAPAKQAKKKPTSPKPAPLAENAALNLVTPSAQDVLASITGIKTASTHNDVITLEFLSSETVLNVAMKKRLLADFVPAFKKDKTLKAEIKPYASSLLATARAAEIFDFLSAAGIEESRIDIIPAETVADDSLRDRIYIARSKIPD